ncbi:hypothetical protein ACM66B_006558 [Microbotryomycetes sp. NB124-2]
MSTPLTRPLSRVSEKRVKRQATEHEFKDTPLRRVARSFHRLKKSVQSRSTVQLRPVPPLPDVRDGAPRRPNLSERRSSTATLGAFSSLITSSKAAAKSSRSPSSRTSFLLGNSSQKTKAVVSYPVLQASSSSLSPTAEIRTSEWGVRTPPAARTKSAYVAAASSSPPVTPTAHVSALGMEGYRSESDDSLVDPLESAQSKWWTSTLNSVAPSPSTRSLRTWPSCAVPAQQASDDFDDFLGSKFSSTTTSSAASSSSASDEVNVERTAKSTLDDDEDIFSSPSFASMTLSPVLTMTTCLSPTSQSLSTINVDSPPSTPTPATTVAFTEPVRAAAPAFAFARTPPLTLPNLPSTPDASRPSTRPPSSSSLRLLSEKDVLTSCPFSELTNETAQNGKTHSVFDAPTKTRSSLIFSSKIDEYDSALPLKRDGDNGLELEFDLQHEHQQQHPIDDPFHPCNFLSLVQGKRGGDHDEMRRSEIVWLDDVDSSDDDQDQQDEQDDHSIVDTLNTGGGEQYDGCSDVDLDFDSFDQRRASTEEDGPSKAVETVECASQSVPTSEASSLWACRGSV